MIYCGADLNKNQGMAIRTKNRRIFGQNSKIEKFSELY